MGQHFYNCNDRTAQDSACSTEPSLDDFLSGVSNDLQLELTMRYPLTDGAATDEP
jgi:hypothetical protein